MALTRKQTATGGFAVAIAMASLYEGLKLHMYHDSGGVPTVCYGHAGARVQSVYTPDECKAMLDRDMSKADAAVVQCITEPMTSGEQGAFDDLAFNIGAPAFCRSSVVRQFNAGRVALACTAIKRYVYAAGRKLAGLARRRQAEYDMCVAEAP